MRALGLPIQNLRIRCAREQGVEVARTCAAGAEQLAAALNCNTHQSTRQSMLHCAAACRRHGEPIKICQSTLRLCSLKRSPIRPLSMLCRCSASQRQRGPPPSHQRQHLVPHKAGRQAGLGQRQQHGQQVQLGWRQRPLRHLAPQLGRILQVLGRQGLGLRCRRGGDQVLAPQVQRREEPD